MAAGHNAGLKGLTHGGQIVIQRLLAAQLQLLEDMIVTAGYQNTGLADAQILHQLKVLLAGADPGGDLREAQTQILALLNGLAVLFAVDEHFRLADNAVGAAQLGHQLIQIYDLLYAVGLYGLLTVTEGGVGDPDLGGHAHGHTAVVKGNPGQIVIAV